MGANGLTSSVEHHPESESLLDGDAHLKMSTTCIQRYLGDWLENRNIYDYIYIICTFCNFAIQKNKDGHNFLKIWANVVEYISSNDKKHISDHISITGRFPMAVRESLLSIDVIFLVSWMLIAVYIATSSWYIRLRWLWPFV